MKTQSELKKEENPLRQQEQEKEDNFTPTNLDELDLIEEHPNFFTKFLAVSQLKGFSRFVCGVEKRRLMKYSDNFEVMINNSTLRKIYVEQHPEPGRFSLFWEIFKIERYAFLTILILSLILGAASAVPIYYQQTLVKSIISVKYGYPYQYVGIIIGVAFFRFFVFNYLACLTNNLSINVKLYIENMFMRAIFFVNNEEDAQPNLKRVKFHSIEAVQEAIVFLPYTIVSLALMISVIVLIFKAIGRYAWVVLGIFLFVLLVQVVFLLVVYYKISSNQEARKVREKISKLAFLSLVSLAFENVTNILLQKITQYKKKELSISFWINVGYTWSQVLAEATIIIPTIVYYSMTHNLNPEMNVLNSYSAAIYLTMMFTPFKIYVYGMFLIMKAVFTYNNIITEIVEDLNSKNIKEMNQTINLQDEEHRYLQDVGCCFNNIRHFESETAVLSQNLPELTLKCLPSGKYLQSLQIDEGETMMLIGRIDSDPVIERFIDDIIRDIPRNKTVCYISEQVFIMPGNVKDNILLFSKYDQHLFQTVLQTVQLPKERILSKKAETREINERLARFYQWHQLRVELARALYQNVDYLIINRQEFLKNQDLVNNIITHRRNSKKRTLIVNKSHCQYLEKASKVLTIGYKKTEVGITTQLLQNQNSILSHMVKTIKQTINHDIQSHHWHNYENQVIEVPSFNGQVLQPAKGNYFKFFNLVHPFGALVVVLSLLAPPCFKYYMNFLLGRSTKGQDIYTDYLTFAIIEMSLLILRGIVLGIYLRIGSRILFQMICYKHVHLNAEQIVQIYQKEGYEIEQDFNRLDDDLIMDFQIGFSLMFQGMISMVIVSTGQPIFLAIAAPMVVVTTFINVLYSKRLGEMTLIRQRQNEIMVKFVSTCAYRSKELFRYRKYEEVNTHFHAKNQIEIMYDANERWLENGFRMVGELTILIGLIIFLVIMVETQNNQISNQGMVGVGVSLFIGLAYSYRFSLKTLYRLQFQLVSLTRCLNLLYKQPNPIDQQQIERNQEQTDKFSSINEIIYRKVTVRFGSRSCSNVNMKISRGERIVVIGEASSIVGMPFYALSNAIFTSDHYEGDLIINSKLTKLFRIENLYYLHNNPVLPILGTIYDMINYVCKGQFTKQQVDQKLIQLFHIIDTRYLFHADTEVRTLKIAERQLLSLFKVLFVRPCQMLVNINGLDNLDIVTRVKLEKYMVERCSINIIITVTNLSEVIELYPRSLHFSDKELTDDRVGRRQQQNGRKND